MKALCLKMGLLLGLAAIMSSLAMPASAAYLYSWSALPNIADIDDGVASYQEVLGIWIANDANYYYFRMDIEAAASTGVGEVDYMLYVDQDQNAGTGGVGAPVNGPAPNSTYVGVGISGIEEIVDAHYVGGTLGINHSHTYDGVSFPFWYDGPVLGSVSGIYQNTENLGTTLEWRVPVAVLGMSPMTVYGATIDIGFPGTTTFDITGGGSYTFLDDDPVVPEPGTFALMGVVGLVAAGVARRRKERQG